MNRFTDFVRQNGERYVAELQALCRQPSIAAQGIGIETTAASVAARMETAGLAARVIPLADGSPVVFAEAGAGERALLIYNHYDVQPAEPLDAWHSDPFAAEIRDGRLYCRGVADNKGPLMARIQAIEAYQELFGDLPFRICFVVEGEEEIGSPHLAHFVEKHGELLDGAVACLWEGGYKDTSGRQVVSLGKKGMCYLELTATGAHTDLHSSWGNLVGNPAWRLTWALSTLKDPGETVTIDGLADHVVEPTAEEWALLREMPFDEARIQEQFGITRFEQAVTGAAAVKRYLFEPTCTICGMDSGYGGPGAKTVLPARARAKLDLRLVPDLTPELAHDLVRAHLDRRGFHDVETSILARLRPFKSDLNHPWVQRSIAALAEFYGRQTIVEPNGAGGGPMYQLCGPLGIPGIAAGGVRHPGSNLHAPNENVYVEDYLDTVAFTGHLLRAWSELL